MDEKQKFKMNMLGTFAKNIGYLTHSRPRVILGLNLLCTLIKFSCSLVNKMEKNYGQHIW